MSINFFNLQAELFTDPANLGYSGLLGLPSNPVSGGPNYQQVANLMDSPGVGSGFTLWRNNITPSQIVNTIQASDFVNFTQNQVNRLNLLFIANPIDATMLGTRANFSNVFSGTATLNSGFLTSLAQYQGSRSEVLFGNGVFVQPLDVARAWTNASGAH